MNLVKRQINGNRWLSRLAKLTIGNFINTLVPSSYFDDPPVANGKCFSNSFAFFFFPTPPSFFPHSFLRSSLPCWATHCAYVRRWQSCQPTPNSLTVIYAGHICLPASLLHVCVCVCVCILAAAWQCVCVCGCAMWLNTFCSINMPRRGSQLASAYFSVRHVSNLLRKIFFNLAIGSPPFLLPCRPLTPLTFGKWHLLTAYFSFRLKTVRLRFNWNNTLIVSAINLSLENLRRFSLAPFTVYAKWQRLLWQVYWGASWICV